MKRVDREILLLKTAVECGVLGPKKPWLKVVNDLEEYIIHLENKVNELEANSKIKKIDEFKDE